MQLQLPNRVQGPPGGWRYRMPETGQDFSGVTEQQLRDRVVACYRANGIPVPSDLPARFETFICGQPEAHGHCVEADGTPPVSPGQMAKVAFHVALEGTRKLVGLKPSVTQAQADARAAVCITCPENVDREGCTNCNMKTVRDLINRIVGNRTTTQADKLGVCRVCLCENSAKVHMSLASLQQIATPRQWEALPLACWMKVEAAALQSPT